MSAPLGLGLPLHTPHAISVSLPTWKDNIDHEEGEERVVNAMTTGYPRAFIHLSIRKLAAICEHKYAVGNEKCVLFPAQFIADECRDFICQRSSVQARSVHFIVAPEDVQHTPANITNLYILLVQVDKFSLAKEFWLCTGLGITSRLAEKCLSLLQNELKTTSPIAQSHKSVEGATPGTDIPTTPILDVLSSDHTYPKERYDCDLPLSYASSAKRVLRRRIANALIRDTYTGDDDGDEPCAGLGELKPGPSSRGVKSVTEDDVYLYPSGMAAIWSAYKLLREARPDEKSVCFGFPYTDTIKVLEKWGPGLHFLGSGLDSDIDSLLYQTKTSSSSSSSSSNTPPILALFTEFPSNPLLRSPNLPKLRALADQYNFLLVVDDTVGNFVNVDVLQYADIVVSSLSKVFSGAGNVMGGSLVLNPNSKNYPLLKNHLSQTYIDTYFSEDAICMEQNSRDFRERINIVDRNTEALCDFLRSRSVAGVGVGDSPDHSCFAIKEVHYPKYVTRENYDLCRVQPLSSPPSSSSSSPPSSSSSFPPSTTPSAESHTNIHAGFGGLFSLSFTSLLASSSFFDALPCYKGPSFGTNFTLACPYTVLAHYGDMEWAEKWGVERGLLRVGVGLDLVVRDSSGSGEGETLFKGFVKALEVAEGVVRMEREREKEVEQAERSSDTAECWIS